MNSDGLGKEYTNTTEIVDHRIFTKGEVDLDILIRVQWQLQLLIKCGTN